MPDSERITLKELAKRLGLTRSHARKYVQKVGRIHGFAGRKVHTRDSGAGPAPLTFSKEEAEIILRERQHTFGTDSKPAQEVQGDTGYFYIIQLVPDLDPKRIKLGFATNVRERLAQHQTSAPTAVCFKRWPCKRSWEQTAIECVTIGSCRLIKNEVFECDDVEAVARKAEEFFKLMPDVAHNVSLADITQPERNCP
jgi:hypothetical protein